VLDFRGQVVVVTGAGRGIGRLYALEFARRGASVVVNDLGSAIDGRGADATVADLVVDEIEAAGGDAVASYESVDSPEGGRAIVDVAVDRFGRLDALVSNAGIFQTKPFDDLTPDDWQRMRAVHLDGGFYLSQPAFRQMKQQPYGRLVFIASSAGFFGQAHTAHYAAAKAGLLGLTNVIAIEGAEHGIRANAVLPFGFTRMVTETVGDEEPQPIQAALYQAIAPELVVPLVVFLASRACDVTHHNFSAGAGRYARAFVGLGEGWLADPGSCPTADDIVTHLEHISATEPYSVPGSIYDEVGGLLARRGLLDALGEEQA
jgi:NAD(P)-dependent dehydrogenase (short-subunit alcohol dehydrogenase family)